MINGKGTQYDLMDVEHWLYKPQNLGAKFNSKYAQIDADFVRTSRIPKPDDIRGRVLFTGNDKYGDYSDFVRFLAAEPLTLVYITNNTYKVSVDVKSLDKSEIEDGILECDIRFKRLGRWYKEVFVKNMDSASTGKTYSHGFPYSYSEYDAETVTINSDSGYDSTSKLIIYGPCENPRWQQYLNGDVILTGACNCTIREGRKFVVDCTSYPFSIHEEDNKGNITANLYGTSDFDTKRFVFLGFGKNRINVEHDGTNVLKMSVEARLEYETV